MDEVYRILKVGAKATIIAPYYSSIRAWQDPTHKRAISENSFFYYNREWRRTKGVSHYPINSDFDFSYQYSYDPYWEHKSEEERTFAFKHYINVILDIRITLIKRRTNGE